MRQDKNWQHLHGHKYNVENAKYHPSVYSFSSFCKMSPWQNTAMWQRWKRWGKTHNIPSLTRQRWCFWTLSLVPTWQETIGHIELVWT